VNGEDPFKSKIQELGYAHHYTKPSRAKYNSKMKNKMKTLKTFFMEMCMCDCLLYVQSVWFGAVARAAAVYASATCAACGSGRLRADGRSGSVPGSKAGFPDRTGENMIEYQHRKSRRDEIFIAKQQTQPPAKRRRCGIVVRNS
jgi:hypothetical protein